MVAPRKIKSKSSKSKSPKAASTNKIGPMPSARRPCKKITLNRHCYKSKQELHAGRNLHQLVLMAVTSFPEKAATFGQIKAILTHDPPNVQVSNYILKAVLKDLRKRKFLTYNTTKFHSTGKGLKAKKPRKKRNKRQRKEKRAKVMRLRKSLVTQADRMSKQRQKVLERVVMKAMRHLKRESKSTGAKVGFMFVTIKARIALLTGKTLRNVVLVGTLQRLRERGVIYLKRARNYIRRKTKKHEVTKKRQPTKATKKGRRKTKTKPKRKASRKAPNPASGAGSKSRVPVVTVGKTSGSLTKLKSTRSDTERMVRKSIMSSIKEMRDQVHEMTNNERDNYHSYYQH